MASTSESSALFSNFRAYYFETPLYEPKKATGQQIKSFLENSLTMDGYCPYCRRSSTFYRATGTTRNFSDTYFEQLEEFREDSLLCARNRSAHVIHVYSLINQGMVQKVGQFPSFADIAIDESKTYSKLLEAEDSAEFHKALGLAAHGVGIGSYVYLRRIFERLIWKRFKEYKDAEGWSEAAFKPLAMKERIELLRNHLPDFLVKNARIYSILSLGVHELSETDCLAFFPVLRQSTVWILEQDKKKQEELAQQRDLEQAIAQFSPERMDGAAK
ncbi:hypothetical protein [Tardiphaga robiniae]|uniref:Uncharacterized protein n=1 Tax=Tardiphaga robiniae TaxID=943830 RepID=A0A7G6TVP6_9BRAD|nr:hypothetical protein [Tardiphaga robiniae]QND70828.1 hypothetical protein HB776_05945 [Tardiphaga robiniae]